jgi:hypothetical protein
MTIQEEENYIILQLSVSQRKNLDDFLDWHAALQLLSAAYEEKMNMMSNSTLIDKAVQKINNMKRELQEIRENSESATDHGIDNSTVQEKEEEYDPQAKFGDGKTANIPRYVAGIGNVYERGENELNDGIPRPHETLKERICRINNFTEDQYEAAKKMHKIIHLDTVEENELSDNTKYAWRQDNKNDYLLLYSDHWLYPYGNRQF